MKEKLVSGTLFPGTGKNKTPGIKTAGSKIFQTAYKTKVVLPVFKNRTLVVFSKKPNSTKNRYFV